MTVAGGDSGVPHVRGRAELIALSKMEGVSNSAEPSRDCCESDGRVGDRAGARAAGAVPRGYVCAARLIGWADAPHYSAPVQRVAESSRDQSHYVEPIDDTKPSLTRSTGCRTTSTPHSVYLDAEAFRELNNENRGEYGGLGFEVALKEGRVKVMAVFEGGPAALPG